MTKIKTAVITGQHAFDVPAFHALFRSLDEVDFYLQDLDNLAADTERVVESARRKLRAKHFDLIVANPVRARETVFGSDHNRGWLVAPRGRAQRLTLFAQLRR